MLHRRQLLTAVGIATISGLAGCSGSNDTEPPTPSAPQTPDYRTVEIQNKGNHSRKVKITVSRDRDGEILHEGANNISAEETQLIYNAASDDLGGDSIRVNVSTDSDNLSIIDHGPDQGPIEIEPNGNLTFVEIVY